MIVIMLLTALYYASICSDASALLLCLSIIRQGLFFMCVVYSSVPFMHCVHHHSAEGFAL